MAFLHDIRHGLRTLRRVPGLVAIAVVTLALGIGANTVIFSVIHTVLLKPLVFPDADRLVRVWMAFPDRGISRASWSHGNFWDARDMASAFEELGAMESGSVNLTGMGDPERLDAVRVTAGFFRVLGVAPAAGRLLQAEDDDSGQAGNVAVLSHRFWTRRYARNPAIVGRAITLNGVPHEIVGVAPPGTPFLDSADVFRPLRRAVNAQRGSWELIGLGRVKRGVTLEAAGADLQRVAAVIAARHPETSRGMSASIAPVTDMIGGDDTRRALWMLLGAVSFLLLIACVNLTNLLLAKAAGRAREIAIRTALGASRQRVAGLLVAESLLLSVGGAALALLASVWALDLLRATNVWNIARLDEVGLNGWVLLFTTLVALAAGVLTGLLPALQAARGTLVPGLREGERGVVGTPRQQRLRAVLVAAEVALTLALLVGAGLLLRSFSALMEVDPGFQAERRVLVEISLPEQYGDDSGKRAQQFLLDFETRVRDLPETISVGSVSGQPLGRGSTGMGIVAAGRPDSQEVPWASWRLVTKDYFKTMGVPVVAGRAFNEGDLISRPWRIIVSRRLAALLWPGQSAIGQQAILWRGQGNQKAEVIGMVGDMRERSLSEPPSLAVYLPMYGSGADHMFFAIHTTAATSGLLAKLRTTLATIDPALPLSNVQTLEEVVSASTASKRFIMLLLNAFAAIALGLALVGIFGVTSYAVARRTAEIGVRLALGASHARLLRSMVVEGMKPVFVGIGAGLLAALLLSRFIATLLFGVPPRDPLTYATVAVLLIVTAAAACLLPARRALRIDVAGALRGE